MHFGSIPDKHVIDHIDGNHRNNRLGNLRAVPQHLNGRNLKNKTNNRSGYPGVYFKKDKQKWCAEMWVSGKKHHLGYFLEREDAIACRRQQQSSHGFHSNHGRMVQ
jgi:hypothetical protein